MMRRLDSSLWSLGMVLAAVMVLPGCGRHHGSGSHTDSLLTASATADYETQADSLASAMSLEEQVGQLFMPAIYSRTEDTDIRQLVYYIDSLYVGGILLLKGDVADARRIAELTASMSPVGMWIAIDAEWGLGMRLRDAPQFPRNGNISADARALYDYGEELARECRATGINMVMGPVADVAHVESFIGNRSFGDDPVHVAEMVTAYSRGLEQGGVMSVAKHFPGHGPGHTDSHHKMMVIGDSRDKIEREGLYPFRCYIDAGLSGIMAGHIAVPALDTTMRPATVSQIILTQLLRQEIGFEGLIITDALNMGGVSGHTAAEAIAAGADIIVAPHHTYEEIHNVIKKVREGELPASVIHERCRRVLAFKYRWRITGPLRRPLPKVSASRLPHILNFRADSIRHHLRPPKH